MAKQNLSPTKPVSPNNPATSSQQLPNLPISPNSHILIHPEHEKGNLIILQQSERTSSNFPYVKVFLTLVILFLLGTTAAIVLIFIPMSQAYNFASNSKESVTISSANIEKVNGSLDILYKARSGSEPNDITLSDETVLDANTKMLSDSIFDSAKHSSERVKDVVDKSSHVKAFSVPANDPSIEVRKHRQLASDIATKVTASKTTLAKLVELKNKAVPSQASELKTNLSKLETDTNKYIDQAQKTSDYYVAVSEASIDLYTLASATNTVKDIDSAISKISSLKSEFASYKALPAEMDSYNQDLVDMFDLLAKYFENLKTAVQGQKLDPNQQYTSFLLQLQSISAKAVSDEITFWQNNNSLSNYSDLAKEHTTVITSSQKVKDANYFFLLSWIGIK